jgi:hypothetical protein
MRCLRRFKAKEAFWIANPSFGQCQTNALIGVQLRRGATLVCQMFKLVAHRQISNGNGTIGPSSSGSHAWRPALTASDEFFSLPLIGAALAWFVCPPAQSAHAAEAVFGTSPRPHLLGGSLNLAKRYRNFAICRPAQHADSKAARRDWIFECGISPINRRCPRTAIGAD